MNSFHKLLLLTGAVAFTFLACEDEYGPRKESAPVFESTLVTPSVFTFGDSVTLEAKIFDPATTLTLLTYQVVSEGRTIITGEIPIGGSSHELSQAIYVPLLAKQKDNADVIVQLTAKNVLKGTTSTSINGLTGKRPIYQQLYLVNDNGIVSTLEPRTDDHNEFLAGGLTFDPAFSFKIAEKLNSDNTIDYSGDVYGNVSGKIEMIDESGESAFSYVSSADYTKSIIFDLFDLEISTTGSQLGSDDLSLNLFEDKDINGESFRVLTRTLEKGKSYSLFGDLAKTQHILNPDFFERVANDKVTFLGETGEYTIYYNPVRKNTFVGVDNPSFPDYLLACGWGLGYPTLVSSSEIGAIYPEHEQAHTSWGFDHVMQYVLLPKISDGIYQGTFMTPNKDHYAGFKPFENTGWGNEKKAGSFTFSGEPIITGDNDWTIPNGESDPVVETGCYRFTINLNNNTVHIEKITL